MKKVKRINESQLRTIVSESVKKILGESEERADLIHGDEPLRRIPKQEPDGPSQEEEEFADELFNLIDSYATFFCTHGYKENEFKDWCKGIVDSVPISK